MKEGNSYPFMKQTENPNGPQSNKWRTCGVHDLNLYRDVPY